MSVDETVAPTRSTPGRTRRLLGPGLVAGTLAVATIALHVRDPHDQGSWGECPTAAMGFHCPGCGGLRAVNDLGNLRLIDAASSNLLFFAFLPLIGYAFVRWTIGQWTGRTWAPSDRGLTLTAIALVVGMVAFTILRNTAAGSWLAP